jgi:signal transduction histidine kinase/CheY-like chemotaxis protein
MRKKKIIAAVMMLLVNLVFAQNKDTTTATQYLSLAEKYRLNDIYASTKFADKAIRQGYAIKFYPAVVRGNLLLGRIQEEQNKTAEAYKYYQKAFRVALDIKDTGLISSCYQYIGVIYKRLELFPKSVEYLARSIRLSKHKKDSLHQYIISKNTLGHVLMDWFDVTKNKRYFDAALENYTSSLNLSRAQKAPQLVNYGYVNLANAYMHYYRTFGNQKYIQWSIELSYKGLNYDLENDHPEWTHIHYLNIGEANYAQGRSDSAIIYYKKAYELNKALEHYNWFEPINRDLAEAYKAQMDYDNALKYILQAINDGVKFHASPVAYDYKILSELYSLKGNHLGALDAYKNYITIENRDKNIKQTLDLEKLQVEYETSIKDKEIIYLNQQKDIIQEKLSKNRLATFSAVIVLVLVIVVCVFLYVYSRNLKRAKELSDYARVMQEQFLANTSHEIRTPMNGIQGMVNLLLDSKIDGEQKHQLQAIKSSSAHLLRIINDLLDLSKIKAGKIEFVSNVFNVKQIINLMKELMQPMAEKKGLKFNIVIDPSAEGYYLGDDIRLEQILINFLSNAVKFTEKGEIGLSVKADLIDANEKVLEFRITDTGIGIPKKKLDLIFESFVQLENAGSRKYGGTGLGLSITKQLVELQGGRIKVKSDISKGSEFIFCIPYKISEGPAEVSLKQRTVIAEKKLKDKKFLIIEDNEINQNVIMSTIQSWRAECVLVPTAVEGFEQLMNTHFDLILMDIELPVLNGWDATEYIRMKFKSPKKDIPIIALTAYASEEDRKKCLRVGMNDVVTKPFSSEELYVKICNLIFGTKDTFIVQKAEHKKERLSPLIEKYQGNDKGLKEMYELYLSELPVYITELEELRHNNNIAGIKKQIHKMKSPLGLVATNEMMEDLNLLQEKMILEDQLRRNAILDKVIRETEEILKEISEKNKLLS